MTLNNLTHRELMEKRKIDKEKNNLFTIEFSVRRNIFEWNDHPSN